MFVVVYDKRLHQLALHQLMNVSILYQAHMAEGSNFNFQKFLSRTFDEDFEVVVGIRLKTPPTALVL